jgi:hypothetical protein
MKGLEIDLENVSNKGTKDWGKNRELTMLEFCFRYLHLFITFCNKGKVKLPLCLTNQALHHERVWVSGCTDTHFPGLDICWS